MRSAIDRQRERRAFDGLAPDLNVWKTRDAITQNTVKNALGFNPPSADSVKSTIPHPNRTPDSYQADAESDLGKTRYDDFAVAGLLFAVNQSLI